MLDIGKSDSISYTYSGRNYVIQVYADNLDSTVFYVVPQPQYAVTPAGLPDFSLRQYVGPSGVSGQCNFKTVLQTPPGSTAAVQNKYGASAKIGAWNWSSGIAWFNYQYPNDSSEMESFSVAAWPSLAPTTGDTGQASAQASFLVSLPTQAAVTAFINAFSGPSAGAFSVQYQMQVPGSLPGVDVTVSFDSQIAYQYEQTISVSKNVWGSETSRTVTVNQYLSQSQAGKIVYVWGAIVPTSPQGQQIQNWANQTLQNQVNQSVNSAIAMMETNNPSGNDYEFNMSQVASFSTEYVSNQVVPWIAQSAAQLAAFPADIWKQLYSEVDTFPLSVVFQVVNIGLATANISSILIEVQSRAGNDQTVLSKTSTNWTFTRPAVTVGGNPDLTYSYKYTVTYNDGTSMQSLSIAGDAGKPGGASVTLNAGDLAALAVTFQTTNVPYGSGANQVSYVEVQFSFTNTNAAPGQAAESKTLSQLFYANNIPWNIAFKTALPYTAPYTYAVKYVLSDGSTYFTAPMPSANNANVNINSPFNKRTVTLFPIWAKGMSNIFVYASYVDPNNTVNVPDQQWSIAESGDPVAPWSFLAPANANAYFDVTAQYQLGAEIVQYQQPWYVQRPPINISSTQNPYMVTVDPSMIDWTKYTMVAITIYTKNGANNLTMQFPFTFKKGSGQGFYSFLVTGQEPSLTWYYQGTYYPVDGAPVPVPETAMQLTQLILPPTWSKAQFMANETPHLSPSVHSRSIEAARARFATGVNLGSERLKTR